jgi:hypothetical protein
VCKSKMERLNAGCRDIYRTPTTNASYVFSHMHICSDTLRHLPVLSRLCCKSLVNHGLSTRAHRQTLIPHSVTPIVINFRSPLKVQRLVVLLRQSPRRIVEVRKRTAIRARTRNMLIDVVRRDFSPEPTLRLPLDQLLGYSPVIQRVAAWRRRSRLEASQ